MRPPPLIVAFAAFGMIWGGWQAALPDLARQYALGTGPLGVILTAGFALALPVMLLTGRGLDRIGVRLGIGIPAGGMVVALLLVTALPPLPVLVAAVVLLAVASGAYDVAINATGMGHQTWSRPARLTLLHASFSGGGAIGAIGAGSLIGSGLEFRLVYPLLATGLLLAVVMVTRAPWAAAAPSGAVPHRLAVAMVPLAILAGLAFLAEGSMETWSAIYLRDELGAGAFVGALGPAAFHAAMLGGRLVGAGVAGTLGAPATLLASGTAMVVGMSLALGLPAPAVAIPGMAMAALGAAFIVPVVVSLAARRAGVHAGRAASYVLTLGYAGFLVGPSLVGILGELFGLRVALLVVPVAALVVVAASRSGVARG